MDKFYQLYEVLKKSSYTEEEILKFEKNAKDWVRTFCQSTKGQMNSAIAIPELYRKEDVTLYYSIYAYVYNALCMYLILCID